MKFQSATIYTEYNMVFVYKMNQFIDALYRIDKDVAKNA
jgi:hypothetical protein